MNSDLSLDDLLADPIIRLLMKSDGVQDCDLRALATKVASRAPRRDGRQSMERGKGYRLGKAPRALRAAAILAAGVMAIGSARDCTADEVPVHVITPGLVDTAPEIALSGQIQARVQSNISFRLNGKVIERRVEAGDHVAKDQVLAVLDPTEQKADVANAQAALNSAQSLLQQAQTTFERQKTLLEGGYTTRASFESAQATLKTTTAQLDAARAALGSTTEQLSYTDLKAPNAGIIVSRSVEPGQVVQTGQTVFVIAEDGPRDAVFDVFEALLTRPSRDNVVEISLQSDPSVRTTGTVREVAPMLDAATSTVKVKIGLAGTPPAMALGAAVVGHGRWQEKQAVVLPWSALFRWEGKPAVWTVDPSGIVSPKIVEVTRFNSGSVTLAGGLDGSERVVTAGIQFLHPGQKVAISEGVNP